MLTSNIPDNRLVGHLLRATALVLTLLGTQAFSAEAGEGVVVEVAPSLTAAELEQLAGPIALYPDDLLAIVLPASTYPLQVVAAARFRANPDNDSAEPDEDWDESIVALLNYPEALALLNEDIDWTWELGQAVADQEQGLMQAIQRVRQEAYAAGNIDSDDKQNVYVKDDVVVIEPADDEVIYVPYYEPEAVVRHHKTRVYHYYPTAYPVYYYPYRAGHYFYDSGFWGLSSFFTLSWSNYHLHHYRHGHRHHRYANHRYNDYHYRYTRHYLADPTFHRRWAHRSSYDYAYNGHWRPRYGHYGARPLRRSYRGGYLDGYRAARQQDRPHRPDRTRHIDRRGRHQYASIQKNRSAFRPTSRERRRDRAFNPRLSDQRSLDQAEQPIAIAPNVQTHRKRMKDPARAGAVDRRRAPLDTINERGAPYASVHRNVQRERNAVSRTNRKNAETRSRPRHKGQDLNAKLQPRQPQRERPAARADRRKAADQSLRRNPQRVTRTNNRRAAPAAWSTKPERSTALQARQRQVQSRPKPRKAEDRGLRRSPPVVQRTPPRNRQRPDARAPGVERQAKVRSTQKPDFRRSVNQRAQPRRVAPAAPRTRVQPTKQKRQPKIDRNRSHRAEGRGLRGGGRMQLPDR